MPVGTRMSDILHIINIRAYFCIFSIKMYISAYCVSHTLQSSFQAEDVPYRSLSTMSRDILHAMMPGVEVYGADLHEGIKL